LVVLEKVIIKLLKKSFEKPLKSVWGESSSVLF